VQPVFAQQAFAAEKAVEAAATLFVWMSSRNTPDSTAVFSFKANDYMPGETPQADALWVGKLTREQTGAACPRHAEVQERTDASADAVTREGNTWWSAQQYGTAVHKRLGDEINALGDPNFKAEKSILKSRDASYYGKKDSIRIDVLEYVNRSTVCVYDIKTGLSGLSVARSAEIARVVNSRYGGVPRIIVIETRPRR
jgi:hypothetical protein